MLLIKLKVRKIRNYFFKPTFLPKNKQTHSTLLFVDLFSFVFSKKVKTPKKTFRNQLTFSFKKPKNLKQDLPFQNVMNY